MVAFETVRLQVEDGVAVLRFNRPAQFNAMNVAMLVEIERAIDQVLQDGAVRALVITGEGKAFSAGADLAATMADPPLDGQGQIDLAYMLRTHYNPIVLKLRAAPIPVIAAVNGIAAGGASSLALLADLTVAARSAVFVQAFVHVGLVPDCGGTWVLPRMLGMQRAMGMAMLGERFDATSAQDLGLVWKVVDDEQLMPEVMKLAQRLSKAPRGALAGIKQGINASFSNDLASQLELEGELQGRCGRSPDFTEGCRAFVEKRAPRFQD